MDARRVAFTSPSHRPSTRFNVMTAFDFSVSAWRRALPLSLTAIVACGGDRPTSTDTTTPPGKPGLTLSGAIDATDTINARLTQPLTVVLRDSLGQPAALKAIRFT